MVRRDSLSRQIEANAADGDNLSAKPGDLVYNMMRMWQGAVGRAPEECMVSPAYVVLTPKDGAVPEFFEYRLKTARMLYLLRTHSQGLTEDRLRLYFDDFKQIPIHLPSSDEQKKIADFLAAVDKKMGLLSRKAEFLKTYKSGVMTRLFTQELRFSDEQGSEFPEWEYFRMGDVFTEIKDKVGSQDLETYSISAGKGFVSQREKFGKDISGKQNANYIVLQPFEFAYNKGNSKSYKYGCVYPNMTGRPIAVPNVFISFRPKMEVAPVFYAKLFEWRYLDRFLKSLISSGARLNGLLNIDKEDFFDIGIPYPSLAEQTKISAFLHPIDVKISAIENQLEEMKLYKLGLLQELLI